MINPPPKKTLKKISIAVLIAAIVFALDLAAPFGVAGGVPYVALVLYGWVLRNRSAFFLLAGAASILTILGFFLSSSGGISWVVFTNRFYAIFAIWVTALCQWWIWPKQSSLPGKARQQTWRNAEGYFSKKEGLMIAALLVIISSSTWGVILRIEAGAKLNIQKSLQTALDTSQISIRAQFSHYKKVVNFWANHPEIRAAAREHIALPCTADALLNSPAQANLREWMTPVFKIQGFRGFFIIGTNNINLASSRDSNVGTLSLLVKQPDTLARLWAGETLVTLPQPSDVPLRDYSGAIVPELATMFVAAPIKDEAGKVIAILAFRLEPDESFTPIFERGRFGDSGETFAFNKRGQLISESRFNEHFVATGLLLNAKHSNLHIEIRDPGVDLTMGESPSLPRDEQPLTFMAQNAIAGKSAMNLDGYRDYRGVRVVGAWLWDDQLGFGIATEVDTREAFAFFKRVRFIIAVFAFLVMAVLLVTLRIFASSRQEIAQREARNSLILCSIGDGIAGLDHKGRIAFVNPKACELLGYQEEELIDQPFHPLVQHSYADGSEYPAENSQICATLIDGEIHHSDDETMWNKDGSSFPIEFVSTPITENCKPNGAVISFMDIAKRKEVEEALSSAKTAAETANKAKSQFLSNMSHEIRTPMNAIMGLTHLIGTRTELNTKQNDYIRKIDSAARSLLGLINDILDFSKVEAGQLNLESTAFNLREVLDNLMAVLGPQARQKKLNLRLDTQSAAPASLIGDPLRLGQVITNLTDNAIKFSEHGEIIIRTELLKRSANRVTLKFFIKDSGIGMSKEQTEKLFKPFSQADASTTRKYGGTGLGLSICKQLSALMGGEIGLKSEAGTGSTFWFTASFTLQAPQKPNIPGPDPIEFQACVEQSAALSLTAAIRGAQILLVEDNEFNQLVAQEVLRDAGLLVEIARNGEQAVQLASVNPYDAILMDIQMPVMDGLAATREIRALPGAAGRTPIIAMTAHAMDGDHEKSLAAGMNDHLTKPINTEELYTALCKFIKPGKRHLPDGTSGMITKEEMAPLLPILPCIDVESALARVRGNKHLYHGMLVKFRRDFGNTADDLAALLHEKKDCQGAERLAHTVKGVAAIIGANGLRKTAAELEKTIKAGGPEKVKELLPLFEEQLKTVWTALAVVEEEKNQEQQLAPLKKSGSPEDLLNLLNELQPHLIAGAPQQCKVVLMEVDAYSWPDLYADDVVELKEMTTRYRFDMAQGILLNLLRNLESKVS